MTKHIHIHIHRAKTSDAGFEESKHKRAANGQFGSGGGGAAPAAKKASGSTLGPQGQAGLKKVRQEQLAAAARKSLGIKEPKKQEYGSVSPTRPGAKAVDPAAKSSGLTPEKARSLSQIDKLERSVAMMEARKPAPAQKVAHARELSDLKAQHARKLTAHEAAHGKIEPSDWSQLKESASRTNETKLENENVARYGKVKG